MEAGFFWSFILLFVVVALSPYPGIPYLNVHLNNIYIYKHASGISRVRSLPQVDFSCNKLFFFQFVISGTCLGLINADGVC